MRTIYLDLKNGAQKVLKLLTRGGIMFFLGRMGMMICSATEMKTINNMIWLRLAKKHNHKNWWGKYYPQFTEDMENDGNADSFKGLYKKLSHLLLLEDIINWAKESHVAQFVKNMPNDISVMLRFAVDKSKLPEKLVNSPAADVILTEFIQGMIVGSGLLYKLLLAARAIGIYLVGTSANFAGEPTIIDAAQLRAFVKSLCGIKKAYVDYGQQRNRKGVDSLTIIQPIDASTARVLRKSVDYPDIESAFAMQGIRLVDDPDWVNTTR